MIILKLGGSILTNKDLQTSEVNYTNLNRLSAEIKEAISNKNSNKTLDDGLIIIHGAGSYGHPPAKKYKIGESFDISEYPEKRIGFSKTQNCVKRLNTIICSNFIDHGIPCVSLQASSFITTKNKRIETFNLDIIKKYLKEGFIPVIYGDVVIDSELKIAVLSGDQILQFIAKKLKSEEVILGTDVDGVFNKNPKRYDNAEIIPNLSSLNQIEEFDLTTNVDVTGGMIGKIKELLELAELGIESKIINANKPKIVLNALENKETRGTVIKITK
ncbi:acetylglutamate kinase [Methanobrevibacter cuticularis]|uniref:Isopentenyl phosphate kinase n=1 Tax=Methanobrevibacter cuticularis TaxID=47311 RepID=A0A166FJB2_9EURY|nr:isopentenyl phosphate kinase [Methanobrevibacter cuticularis]KZX17734.1 acetylglutamate kinase [Methanobrevibacter cuticularis]